MMPGIGDKSMEEKRLSRKDMRGHTPTLIDMNRPVFAMRSLKYGFQLRQLKVHTSKERRGREKDSGENEKKIADRSETNERYH